MWKRSAGSAAHLDIIRVKQGPIAVLLHLGCAGAAAGGKPVRDNVLVTAPMTATGCSGRLHIRGGTGAIVPDV